MIKKFMEYISGKNAFETEINGRVINVVTGRSNKEQSTCFTKALLFAGVEADVKVDCDLTRVETEKVTRTTIYEFVKGISSRGSWVKVDESENIVLDGEKYCIYGKFKFKSEENGANNLATYLDMDVVKDDNNKIIALKGNNKIIPLCLCAYGFSPSKTYLQQTTNAYVRKLFEDYEGERYNIEEENIIESILTSRMKNAELSKAKVDYDRYALELDRARKTLIDTTRLYEESTKKLQRVESNNFNITLTKNTKIKRYELVGDKLIAYTIPLIITATNGGKYRLGKMRIEFNITNSDVRFFSDEGNYRTSYWGSTCQHPHVKNNGQGCLGNASEAIASFTTQREYSALFDVCIAYLESANLDDPAGCYVMNWDRVDKDGNVIQKGYKDLEKSYFEYGKTADEDRCTYRMDVCPHCGTEEKEEDMFWVQSEGQYVCWDCRETYYAYCEECDELYQIEDLEDGLCEHCYDEKEKKRLEAEETKQEACEEESEEENLITTKSGIKVKPNEAFYCSSCNSYHTTDEFLMSEMQCIQCHVEGRE